jgi:hypothetical protein
MALARLLRRIILAASTAAVMLPLSIDVLRPHGP